MIRTKILLLVLCVCATFRVFGQDEEEEQTLPKTTMAIEENEYYFGKIAQGDTIMHDFEIRNTGVNPLVIYGAKGSCPCLTVAWPSDTIMPNGTGLIHSIYDSSTKVGPQTKQITVYANTEEQGIMYVKGEVRFPSDSVLLAYDREAEMKQLAESEERWKKFQDSLQKVNTWDYQLAHYNDYQIASMIRNIKDGVTAIGFFPPLTSPTFANPSLSVENVKQGDIIKHSFEIYNNGENPLYILKVEANPDIIKISNPQQGVLPGLSGEIAVELETSNILGNFKEQIVISTNSSSVETIISIQGKVHKRK